MGAVLEKTHLLEQPHATDQTSSGWGFEIPAKNTNYAVPETVLDKAPEWKGDEPPVTPARFDINEIIAAAESPATETTELAKRLLDGLVQHRLVIFSMNDEQTKEYGELLNRARPFLTLSNPLDKKKFYATKTKQLTFPNEKSTLAEGATPLSSGYYDIHFDNRNNVRDEEWRDVYLLYCHEQYRADLQWPSEELRQSMTKFANLFWSTSVALLTLLERALNLESNALIKHLVYPETEVKIENSVETNFAVFRYYDNAEAKRTKDFYASPQRCMVHRDRGFVTLLPKATEPGIQAFCQSIETESGDGANPNNGIFVELERYTSKNDVIVYTGRLLEMVTKGAIKPLIHRVVRYPKLERFSSPFEAKCNPDTVIIEHPTTHEPVTAHNIIRACEWDSLQRTVLRADGVPPEEHQPHINGQLAELLRIYGDALVVNE